MAWYKYDLSVGENLYVAHKKIQSKGVVNYYGWGGGDWNKGPQNTLENLVEGRGERHNTFEGSQEEMWKGFWYSTCALKMCVDIMAQPLNGGRAQKNFMHLRGPRKYFLWLGGCENFYHPGTFQPPPLSPCHAFVGKKAKAFSVSTHTLILMHHCLGTIQKALLEEWRLVHGQFSGCHHINKLILQYWQSLQKAGDIGVCTLVICSFSILIIPWNIFLIYLPLPMYRIILH